MRVTGLMVAGLPADLALHPGAQPMHQFTRFLAIKRSFLFLGKKFISEFHRIRGKNIEVRQSLRKGMAVIGQ